ncbi:MAG: ABC transporter ATP-binding protein/permease [Lachnospiraceae bacterium]|nr:ABC transporter ATP-binding protein/permease [Lachnospiraceae bacterium]
MKKLLPYLKEYRRECILSPLFKMLEAILELLVPLVVAAMIDQGITAGRRGYLLSHTLILVGLAVVGLGVSVTAQYFAAKAAVGFATNVRSALFKHLQSYSYTQIDQMGTSTMITRMTGDITLAQNGVNMVLRLLLRSPFVVFGAMIMAFTIDVWSAILFVVVIFGLSAVVFLIMSIHIPMMKLIQQKVDGLTGTVRENLTGVRVIRAFVKESEEIGRFGAGNAALLREQEKTGRISGLLNPLTYVIVNLGVIFLLRTGALQVSRGILTQGQVIALYNYMSQILVELIKLANLIVTVNKALAGADRIADALSVKVDPPRSGDGARSADTALVVFDHVSLTYQGAGDAALSDLCFEAGEGECIGIIGPTGCGKSSLVHLLAGFYPASEGSVRVKGRDVRDIPSKELLDLIGIAPQKPVLFAGSIADNLRWGKEDATSEEMEEAIRIAQASDVVTAKGGPDGMIEQGGRNLSGGQKQRLTVARALIGRKPILILDDTSSALDTVTDKAMREAIAAMQPRPLTFIVSQRTNAVQDADKILVMENGRILAQGRHEELLDSCEVYREIYDSQKKPVKEVAV